MTVAEKKSSNDFLIVYSTAGCSEVRKAILSMLAVSMSPSRGDPAYPLQRGVSQAYKGIQDQHETSVISNFEYFCVSKRLVITLVSLGQVDRTDCRADETRLLSHDKREVGGVLASWECRKRVRHRGIWGSDTADRVWVFYNVPK